MPKIYVNLYTESSEDYVHPRKGVLPLPDKIMSMDVTVTADLNEPDEPDEPDRDPMVRLHGTEYGLRGEVGPTITISLQQAHARDLIEQLNQALQKIEDADNPYKLT